MNFVYDTKRFWTCIHVYIHHDDIIKPYLDYAYFGHVINFTSYVIDNKFILALVERYRPEIHTFYLTAGE